MSSIMSNTTWSYLSKQARMPFMPSHGKGLPRDAGASSRNVNFTMKNCIVIALRMDE